MNTKMAAIFGVLIIGLAAMGASYAVWSETLTVSGTVAAGEFDAEFSAAFTDDDETVDNSSKDADDAGPDPKECGPNPTRYAYDTATSSASGVGAKTATVTVMNSYPSYYTTAWFDIKNTGTVPLNISSVTPTNVPSELTVTVVEDPTGTELEMGEEAQLGICVHVGAGASEGTTYTFGVTVETKLFNA